MCWGGGGGGGGVGCAYFKAAGNRRSKVPPTLQTTELSEAIFCILAISVYIQRAIYLLPVISILC